MLSDHNPPLSVIHFGTMSIVLMLGTIHGLVVMALLLFVKKNRMANRFLAALLLMFVLRITPYIIGYAGYYDRYPWLSFAPLAITFAFGPLVYLYVRSLTAGRQPRGWPLFLLPAALQTAYYLWMFSQPLAFKNYWDAVVQRPWISPFESLFALLMLTVCWAASVREYRRYQAWLLQNVSDQQEFRLTWILNFLIALGATLLVWATFEVTEWLIRPLNYYQRFPLFLWQMLLVYYLATEGWRNAGIIYPRPSATIVPELSAPLEDSIPTQRDWHSQAEKWRAEILKRELWSDPEITLTGLSRLLGTNTSHLSRALNEGLGQNFNEFVNRLRVRAVAERLADEAEQRDVLEIAIASGFRSKASFNRSFKLYAGMTPTQFRQNKGLATSQIINTSIH